MEEESDPKVKQYGLLFTLDSHKISAEDKGPTNVEM